MTSSAAIEEQLSKQRLLIASLRVKTANLNHTRDADHAVKVHAMLAHALAGLAALCNPSGGGQTAPSDSPSGNS